VADLRSSLLKLSPTDLQGSSLEVCRNAHCYRATISGVRDPLEDGSGLASFPDVEQRDTLHTPLIYALLWKRADGYEVEITYTPWVSNDATDGDVYDVLLTSANGTRLLEAHQTVKYQVTMTCGGECIGFVGNI